MPSSAPSIKLGSFREFRLRLALPLSLFQPEPWASAILVDELDPGQLKRALYYRKRGVTRFRCLTFE